jgi:hypothetical protein
MGVNIEKIYIMGWVSVGERDRTRHLAAENGKKEL